MKHAAVSLCERWLVDRRLLLVVWNKRYGAFTLPGGLVEPGESPAEAQRRELSEETGLETVSATPIYEAEAPPTDQEGRASRVHVFRVVARGIPLECELGCPVTWHTYGEFLRWCPFAGFYRTMFRALACEVGGDPW